MHVEVRPSTALLRFRTFSQATVSSAPAFQKHERTLSTRLHLSVILDACHVSLLSSCRQKSGRDMEGHPAMGFF